MLYDMIRDDLQDAISLMNEMKGKGYNVSLTDILIANLNITLEKTNESIIESLSDVAENISYLQ